MRYRADSIRAAPLLVIATLFGMQPAYVENCRVLEIGCAHPHRSPGLPVAPRWNGTRKCTGKASGKKLLTQAAKPELLPNSRFLGIDASGRQVEQGQKIIEELQAFGQASDAYLFHELLEDNNDPVYFHEFIARAAAKKLQYLGEAEISAMWLGNLPEPIAATLRGLSGDLVQMEQFMDFLRNRTFRQTLLCHDRVTVQRWLKPEHLKGKYVAGNLTPAGHPVDPQGNGAGLRNAALNNGVLNKAILSNDLVEFRSESGATISTPDRIMKAALVYLAEVWPEAVKFETLLAKSRERLDGGPIHDAARLAEDTEILGNDILKCFAAGLAEIRVRLNPTISNAVEKPRATLVARKQAKASNGVPNLRHQLVQLSDLDRHVLRHIDGEHDREQLVMRLLDLVNDGTLLVNDDAKGTDTHDKLRPFLLASLLRLKRFSLLSITR